MIVNDPVSGCWPVASTVAARICGFILVPGASRPLARAPPRRSRTREARQAVSGASVVGSAVGSEISVAVALYCGQSGRSAGSRGWSRARDAAPGHHPDDQRPATSEDVEVGDRSMPHPSAARDDGRCFVLVARYPAPPDVGGWPRTPTSSRRLGRCRQPQQATPRSSLSRGTGIGSSRTMAGATWCAPGSAAVCNCSLSFSPGRIPVTRISTSSPGRRPSQPDQLVGEVDDGTGLPHVQHEDLATLDRAPALSTRRTASGMLMK